MDPAIFWIAEYAGKMIGFFMALRDYNIPLMHVHGKLGLIGVLQLLWYRRKIDQARVFAICALPGIVTLLGLWAGICGRKCPS